MNFIIFEFTEGGADVTDSDYAGVVAYLGSNRAYWRRAAQEFAARTWVPGDWLHYPCGYIFCVNHSLT